MGADSLTVSPWMMLPFGALLGLIALMPLLTGAWWARHYPKVALGLAAVSVAWYGCAFGWRGMESERAVAHDYLSFIVLIGSLYVVSGGIHIQVRSGATPWQNVVFLIVGTLVANVLGTTGASMLLIRPWLRMNHGRLAAYHVVFFIFILSNVGGCLTPISDPPLYLGYLAGIPFWWVIEHCLAAWAVGMGILLLMFFILDRRNFLRGSAAPAAEAPDASRNGRIEGLRNLIFLAVILGAVFIRRPVFLSEALLAGAALGSWFATPKAVHAANHFDFHPLREVAILFAAIFATMTPALDWLQGNAGHLAIASHTFLFWGCGSLSSVLDSAPTYLCFLQAIAAHCSDPDVVRQVSHLVQTHGADLAGVAGPHAAQVRETWAALQQYYPGALAAGAVEVDRIEMASLLGHPAYSGYLVAISVGAVFFGANTYLGNGPNLMVKAIADQRQAPTPGFLGFIFKFTLPFMLPMLVVVWWLFFRG
jgi:Na+/H+ antiporter NhaD/arsenite permease-like protein